MEEGLEKREEGIWSKYFSSIPSFEQYRDGPRFNGIFKERITWNKRLSVCHNDR